jgi:dihydrofolate reductase
MRKIILNVAVTLDSFIEGPNGEYDWCFTDQDYGMKEFLERVDTIFYGRKSYELMITTEGMSLEMWGDRKNYVFSNSLESVQGNSTIISGDVLQKVKEIKAEQGKEIWLFGGASLTTTLMNANLVDELLVAVHPIILGRGKPLFIDIDKRITLKLINSNTFSTGLIQSSYEILR